MKQSFQKQYNDSINLISHLILTKPTPVIGLLEKHGVSYNSPPNQAQIIGEVVELLKSNNPKFQDDLGKLLTLHIQYQGKEMLALERENFSSYDDNDEDEFWGAIAKVGVGLVSSIFKGKKRKRRTRGGGNAATLAASQAAQMKRDMQRQAERIRREAAERRRAEETRRRIEASERRRREAAAKKERAATDAARKKQTNTMLMAGGGITLLVIIGVFMAKSNSKPTYPYMPAPIQPISGR